MRPNVAEKGDGAVVFEGVMIAGGGATSSAWFGVVIAVAMAGILPFALTAGGVASVVVVGFTGMIPISALSISAAFMFAIRIALRFATQSWLLPLAPLTAL